MRDARADICQRAWTPCPDCGDQRGCGVCASGRTCESHWRFLLAAEGRRLFLQCRACLHRWWHDTGFGVGDRPYAVDRVPAFQ